MFYSTAYMYSTVQRIEQQGPLNGGQVDQSTVPATKDQIIFLPNCNLVLLYPLPPTDPPQSSSSCLLCIIFTIHPTDQDRRLGVSISCSLIHPTVNHMVNKYCSFYLRYCLHSGPIYLVNRVLFSLLVIQQFLTFKENLPCVLISRIILLKPKSHDVTALCTTLQRLPISCTVMFQVLAEQSESFPVRCQATSSPTPFPVLSPFCLVTLYFSSLPRYTRSIYDSDPLHRTLLFPSWIVLARG